MQKIPTYRANGERRRDYSREAVEKLEAAGRVIVERDPAGMIVAAQFRPEERPPVAPRLSIPTGTYYSYEEMVPAAGHAIWQHKDLKRDAAHLVGGVEVDDFLRRIFRAVPLSCMEQPVASGTAAVAEAVCLGPRKRELDRKRRRQARQRKRQANA